MSNVSAHYERVLGSVYTWMMGGAEERLEAARRFLAALAIEPDRYRSALDLGAGSGFWSVPLAELGFSVTAVDLSPTLLDELRERARSLPVRTLERDLLPVTDLVDEPQALVVCAGDTLAHLADHASVDALVGGAARVLADEGRLVLTWRELGIVPRGDERFLPVRSSPDRIFTCFLEELDDSHVRVTDLVHERQGDGFAQRIGSYVKLRIPAALVDALLVKHGFAIEVASADGGLVTRVGRRGSR